MLFRRGGSYGLCVVGEEGEWFFLNENEQPQRKTASAAIIDATLVRKEIESAEALEFSMGGPFYRNSACEAIPWVIRQTHQQTPHLTPHPPASA